MGDGTSENEKGSSSLHGRSSRTDHFADPFARIDALNSCVNWFAPADASFMLLRWRISRFMGTPSDLLPGITIDGEDCFLDTPAMAAIPANVLGKRIGSLAEFRALIADARDRLFGAY